MSAGFCNWVYRVEMPQPVGSVVVKLFSPLAKLRLTPPLRGFGDELAGERGLGPRLLFRNAEGLVCDFVPGDTLTEQHIHGGSVELPKRIAPRLAALHSVALQDARPSQHAAHPATQPVLWDFLESMLVHIESADADADAALANMPDAAEVRREVARMRSRCDALGLPVVVGHGDLKPSNVMSDSADPDGGICFIDFELAGAHYRGYDLYKLFRTAGEMSRANMGAFLTEYLAGLPGTPTSAEARRLMLDELQVGPAHSHAAHTPTRPRTRPRGRAHAPHPRASPGE